MRTFLLLLAVLALLALDWAALDDILGGRESNYAAEYAMLFLSAAAFAGLITYGVARKLTGRGLRAGLLAGFVVLLLVLDWAALHDIIKGNEPSYWMEYSIVGFSLVVFAGIAFGMVSRRLLRSPTA